ncbi:hypothetical protein [Flavobacterium aquidurense]|uniref:DUF1579 domain-containing protein n=1 Tax=Flavobacterium aquidurense TaxID=362413 RepID=A0A0Q0WEG2_9FLAO|nr:hypothetical protein [Flavobacterium aquidurense]KQB42675.1 hypothetical protein RC62_3682 [Flavobacterium aquidurense]
METIETSNFSKLIGIWVTKGTVLPDHAELIGIDTYEYILNGNYILHKADVKMGNERSQTFEIISLANTSLANTTKRAKMQYYNTKGKSGSMTGYLTKNIFKIRSTTMKFEGKFNDESTELIGKWFLKENDKWINFIDLKLKKQKESV